MLGLVIQTELEDSCWMISFICGRKKERKKKMKKVGLNFEDGPKGRELGRQKEM